MTTTNHKLRPHEPMFIEGTHGCYASIAVEKVETILGQHVVHIALSGHKSAAKPGKAPGPLSAPTCDAMIEAMMAAMVFLDKIKKTNLAAAEHLAKLAHAEKLLNAEIAEPGYKSLLKYAAKGGANPWLASS